MDKYLLRWKYEAHSSMNSSDSDSSWFLDWFSDKEPAVARYKVFESLGLDGFVFELVQLRRVTV